MKANFISSLLVAVYFNIISISPTLSKSITIRDYELYNTSSKSSKLSQANSNLYYQYIKTLEHKDSKCGRDFLVDNFEESSNLIAINSRMNLIISGCGKYIELSRLSDGKLLNTLSGHAGIVSSLRVNADTLVSTANDNTIRIWGLPSGKLLHTIFPSSSKAGGRLAVSADSPVMTTLNSNILNIWKVTTGKLLRRQVLSEYAGVSTSMAISPDGKTIAVGFEDKTVKVWKVSDGKLLHTLDSHLSQVSDVAISPDGKTIVSGSFDGTVKIWRLSDGELLKTLSIGSSFTFDYMSSVAISADNSTVIAAGYNMGDNFYIWRLSDGQVIGKFKVGRSPANSTAVSSDGKTVICDGEIFRRK